MGVCNKINEVFAVNKVSFIVDNLLLLLLLLLHLIII